MSGSNIDVIDLQVWNRFTWRARVLFFFSPPSQPPPVLPGVSLLPHPALYPPIHLLDGHYTLSSNLHHPAAPPSSGSVCPSHSLPKATGNSWRVWSSVSLRVELTGAPLFVSTLLHYHWIMVIINMVRPGGVGCAPPSIWPLSPRTFVSTFRAFLVWYQLHSIRIRHIILCIVEVILMNIVEYVFCLHQTWCAFICSSVTYPWKRRRPREVLHSLLILSNSGWSLDCSYFQNWHILLEIFHNN